MGSSRKRALPWLLAMAAIACSPAPPPSGGAGAAPFREVGAEVGLHFEHFNGMYGEFHLPEIVGSGVAWFDYDRDGDMDLYVVQGAMIDPALDPSGATPPWPGPGQPGDRLFRNDLATDASGKPRVSFVDVTEDAGIEPGGYGMGVATGDYDNDGWTDLYVTQLGENRLRRNTGDGRFVDTTARSGIRDPWWSVSASFVDLDADGWLDLFVADYLDWSLAVNKECYLSNGLEDFCGPASYLPVPDRLFRNRGDGTFEQITATSGIATAYGAGLGVVSGDFNADGKIDLYVANDGLPNQLWLNQGGGRLVNDALLAGCAVNADGKAEASMGIDAADFDEDGDEDLFMAHLNEETNTLYVNDGAGGFADQSAFSGLGPPSHAYTGFGAGWVDFDNDGWLDLYVVNGAVHTLEDQARAGDPYPLRQINQLFRNRGDGSYEEVPGAFGDELAVSRGSAFADVDNDGDLDLAISNNTGTLRLYLNEAAAGNHWIGLDVVGPAAAPRPMLGAWVRVTTASGRSLYRRVRSDGSYASANDPRLTVGLGAEDAVSTVDVTWPDGTRETWSDLAVDTRHRLAYGAGTGG